MFGIQRSKQYLKQYVQSELKLDLVAALTVAMVAVPQAMAYAAIIPTIVAAIFGSSNHVVTGPTNTIALATSGVLVAVSSASNYPEFVFAIAILSGTFRLLLGGLKLGFLIRYVSNSVLTGFLAGAAVLIMLNQFPKLLGLTGSGEHDLIGILRKMARDVSGINYLVLALGLVGILLLIFIRRYFPKLPAAMFVLILSGLTVKLFGWQEYGIRVIGEKAQWASTEFTFIFLQVSSLWKTSACC